MPVTMVELRKRIRKIKRQQHAFYRRFQEDPEFREKVKAEVREQLIRSFQEMGAIPKD